MKQYIEVEKEIRTKGK